MLKLTLLFLTLSGLQAVPIAAPGQKPSTNHKHIPEHIHKVPANVPAQKNGGGWVRVEESLSSRPLPDGFRQGTERFLPIPDGFRQGTERSMAIPDGFKQGTEPFISIRDGFKQGTEPFISIRDGFKQGTEPFIAIRDGFKQGTEPFISIAHGFKQGTEPFISIRDGFKQGTEPFIAIRDGFKQGTEPFISIAHGFRQGTEPFMFGHHGPRQETEPTNKRVACKGKVIDGKCFESNPSPMNFYEERANQQQAKHLSKRDVVIDHSRQGPVKTPTQKNGGHKVCTEESPSACLHGYRQGSEPLMPIQDGVRQNTEPRITIRDGFRQGTERFMPIRDGFRQGTERFMAIKDGFRQGTERFMAIKDGFRQGTERFMAIKDGFRQGTERFMAIKDGFRQGTERFMAIKDGFRQGTERFLPIHDDFQQGTESFKSSQYGFRQGTEPDRKKMICKGGAIHGICYVFNPTLLTFNDAQNVCKDLAPNAKLVTVNSSYLHKHLVSLVTGGGKNKPVATWLGGTIKNQKASWEDGSEWKYSRWMPGYPNIHTDKPLCVEMFKKGVSSWTTADCHQTRASICSYPMTA